MYGSDQSSSIEPEGVFKLAKYIRGTELAIGDGIKKIYESEKPIMAKLRR
jgi:N-acetylneuraminate synthase